MLSDPSDEMWRRGWREGQSFGSTGWPLGAPMHHAHRFLRAEAAAPVSARRRGQSCIQAAAGARRHPAASPPGNRPGIWPSDRPGSPLTVSRETARNAGRDPYQAATADTAAYGHGRRPKQTKLAQRPAPPAPAEAKPALCRSPEQIAGRG